MDKKSHQVSKNLCCCMFQCLFCDILVMFDWILSLFYHHPKIDNYKILHKQQQYWGCSHHHWLLIGPNLQAQPLIGCWNDRNNEVWRASHNWTRWSSCLYLISLCYVIIRVLEAIIEIKSLSTFLLLRRWWWVNLSWFVIWTQSYLM